jgi:hypothetical protein
MKKWLSIFLLIITVAGTIIPCCALDDCCADRNSSSTNHEKHGDEGTCSPFFACTTCSGFVELAAEIQIQQSIGEKPVHHEKILQLNLSTYSAFFWQPPRLS